MANNLQQMGSLSAGNKENNIFKVFAYLNTRHEFSPFGIMERVNVKSPTILKYLKEVQEAQFFSDRYLERINRPFEEHFFASSTNSQELEISKKALEEWQKQAAKVDDDWREKHSKLLQFQFTGNRFVPAKLFYERLENSILFYTIVTK